MSYIHDAVVESHNAENEIALNKIKNPPELKRPKVKAEQMKKPIKESLSEPVNTDDYVPFGEPEPYVRDEYEESMLQQYRKSAGLAEDFEITEDNIDDWYLGSVAGKYWYCTKDRVRHAVLGIPWEEDFSDMKEYDVDLDEMFKID